MKYFLSILLMVSTVVLLAQNVSVVVETPRVVRVGVPFQLIVKVNADASNPRLPEMTAFTVLANRGRSSSSSISIVNGNVTRSTEIAFTYVLQANQEGTHEIGAAEVTVDRNTYRSAPVSVQVVDANTSTTQPQQGSGGGSGTGSGSGTGTGTGTQPNNPQQQTDAREIYVETLTDRRQVYQGEYINASVKIFSRIPITSISNIDFPTFDGFFKQEIETPQIRSLNEEMVNGVLHLTGVLQNYVLFPQRSGTLTISQSKMEVGINQRVQGQSRNIFDDFFGRMQTVRREVIGRPVTITVLPLPDGKPASFSGGVGQMRLNINIDKTEVKANEPVILKATVSGNGNMRFVDAPRINFPPDLKYTTPKSVRN